MQSAINQQVILARRPDGVPEASNFQIVDVDIPEPGAGEILIQTLYLSVDPGMRAMMVPGRSHTAAFELGQPLTGRSVGRVVASHHDDFAVGDYVTARLGWQHYSLADGQQVTRVDPELAPLSTYLGIVGVPGFCAYFGLLDIGRPQPGETVVVSGAAGAVGMTTGQIAKRQGARVVGTAGTSAKTRYLCDELGFDAAINYRTTDDLSAELAQACPDGIDVYFDNVGGDITQAVLSQINHGARIVVCGQTSQYNDSDDAGSGRISPQVLIKHSALMQGFVVYDYADRNDEAIAQLGRWIRDGDLRYRENIVDGLDNAPQAFIDLFGRQSFGKQLVRLAS